MTRKLITVTPAASFKEAVRLLESKRVSGLPVVDQAGQLVGIVTEAVADVDGASGIRNRMQFCVDDAEFVSFPVVLAEVAGERADG